jgi:hypothetical protein
MSHEEWLIKKDTEKKLKQKLIGRARDELSIELRNISEQLQIVDYQK